MAGLFYGLYVNKTFEKNKTVPRMEIWVYATMLASIFYILGNIFLKMASIHPVLLGYWFAIGMGTLGLIGLLGTVYIHNGIGHLASRDIVYAVVSGSLFFFGNLLWIYALERTPNIAYVYVLMASLISVALMMFGVYMFHQHIYKINIIGITFILIGVYFLFQKPKQ